MSFPFPLFTIKAFTLQFSKELKGIDIILNV